MACLLLSVYKTCPPSMSQGEPRKHLVEDAGAGNARRCSADLLAQRHPVELPVRQLVQIACTCAGTLELKHAVRPARLLGYRGEALYAYCGQV